MIEKIGVIYEDANSLGFLKGLRDRLGCHAELIAPPTAIGKVTHLTRKTARQVWEFFGRRGVHLVVRFADADQDRWHDVIRDESSRFPDAARSLLVYGAAVRATEDWLALDRQYLADKLDIPLDELVNSAGRIGCVKRALARANPPDQNASDFVADLVRNAPPEVFRRWLRDTPLRRFYEDCRAAATRADCDTPNELDTAG